MFIKLPISEIKRELTTKPMNIENFSVSFFKECFEKLKLGDQSIEDALAVLAQSTEAVMVDDSQPMELRVSSYCLLILYYEYTGNYDRLINFVYLNGPDAPDLKCIEQY